MRSKILPNFAFLAIFAAPVAGASQLDFNFGGPTAYADPFVQANHLYPDVAAAATSSSDLAANANLAANLQAVARVPGYLSLPNGVAPVEGVPTGALVQGLVSENLYKGGPMPFLPTPDLAAMGAGWNRLATYGLGQYETPVPPPVDTAAGVQ